MAAGGARALLNEATTRQLGGASVHSSRSQKPAASAARCPSRAQRGCRRAVLVFAEAESGGANPFAKLGRVLQEKARSDFDRVFKARRPAPQLRAAAQINSARAARGSWSTSAAAAAAARRRGPVRRASGWRWWTSC